MPVMQGKLRGPPAGQRPVSGPRSARFTWSRTTRTGRARRRGGAARRRRRGGRLGGRAAPHPGHDEPDDVAGARRSSSSKSAPTNGVSGLNSARVRISTSRPAKRARAAGATPASAITRRGALADTTSAGTSVDGEPALEPRDGGDRRRVDAPQRGEVERGVIAERDQGERRVPAGRARGSRGAPRRRRSRRSRTPSGRAAGAAGRSPARRRRGRRGCARRTIRDAPHPSISLWSSSGSSPKNAGALAFSFSWDLKRRAAGDVRPAP